MTVDAEWCHGWRLVLVSTLGLGVGTIHAYALGVLMEPVQETLGLSRAVVSSGPMVVAIVAVLAAPVVGTIVDRWGARATALPGVVIYCLGFSSLSISRPSIVSWLLCWGLIAVGAVMLKPMVWLAAVGRKFQTNRALAFGIVVCGGSLAISIVPVTLNALINALDWRRAVLVLSSGALVIVLPIVVFWFKDAPSASHVESRTQSEGMGITVQDGLRSGAFRKLCIVALVFTTAQAALIIHIVPILESTGWGQASAAKAAGLIGVLGAVGRVATGYLLDRLPGPRIAGWILLLPVSTAAILYLTPFSEPLVVGAIMLLGLANGGELNLLAYASSRYFGLRHYGVLFGVINSLIVLAAGFGAFISGAVFDATGNYRLVLLGVIPAFMLTAACIFSLKNPTVAHHG